jgi:MSHA biogenesis protein MshE
MNYPERLRLGDILVQQNLITPTQLQFALAEQLKQKQSGRRLGRVLVEQRLVSEDQISETLAMQFNIPFINLKHYNVNVETSRRLSEIYARRFRSVVLNERDGKLLIGMVDPTDTSAIAKISLILKDEIELAVVTEGQMLEIFGQVY